MPGLRPGFAVVILGSGPPAPLHCAAGTGPGQGDLLSGRWPAAEVSHIEDIHPAGDHQVQNRTPQQLFGDRHRHRADAADLAQLATGHPAAVQGLHIDPQQRQIPRIQPPRQPRRQQVSARLAGTPTNLTMLGVPLVGSGSDGLVGECHQRVEGVGLRRLGAAGSAGGGEHPVGERVQHHGERGPGLWGAPRVQVPEPLPVDVPAQPPSPMQPAVGGLRVRVGAGPHPGAFLPQLRHRHPPGQLHQPVFLGRVRRHRSRNDRGLRQRHLTASQRPRHPGLLRQPGRGVQRILRRPGRGAGPAGQVLDCGLGPRRLRPVGLPSRRASNVFPAAHNRSDLSSTAHNSPAVDPLTASGSNRSTKPANRSRISTASSNMCSSLRDHADNTPRYPQARIDSLREPSRLGTVRWDPFNSRKRPWRHCGWSAW